MNMYQTGIGAVKATIIPVIVSAMLAVAPDNGHASDFTAGFVMAEMEQSDRFPFVAGIIEGLAYARFVSDDRQTEGMGCIYDWFYDTDGRIMLIYEAFEAFPDHLPGAVVAALLEGDCGE